MKSIVHLLLLGALAQVALVETAQTAGSDAEIERLLLSGQVVSIKEIGSGVTKPRKVVLELDGRRIKAAFKTIKVHRPGLTRFPDGTTEVDFTDDYRYELAAYLLDRRLGMNMAPVTVLREINGERGALTEWVEDATSEARRMKKELAVPELLRHQQSMMRMFDALIFNVDRHESNQLVTPDGKLHLIDHSRSFRKQRSLPKGFVNTPAGVSPEVFRNLQSLESEELLELLGDVLSPVQVKALMRRRDKILEKIRADLAEYGEWVVFHETADRSDP